MTSRSGGPDWQQAYEALSRDAAEVYGIVYGMIERGEYAEAQNELHEAAKRREARAVFDAGFTREDIKRMRAEVLNGYPPPDLLPED